MAVLVVHCGAHSTEEVLDGAERALAAGLQVLRQGGDALDAVLRAVTVLEDDQRMNAGTGSHLNLAGEVEMDASVMDSRGQAGAVGALSGVKNPVLVAREVMRSPHLFLAGEGAVRFARETGFPEYDATTSRARRELERVRAKQRSALGGSEASEKPDPGDTVGAAARDESGYMAAANSTGGISLQLPGRVGDTPVIGAGIYAGPAGAVAATGIGEEIIRAVLSKQVYDRLLEGKDPQMACDEGVGQFPSGIPVGLIAVASSGFGAAANTRMAWRSGSA
ncbi:MAG: isoaspartyl peptidase/L-asparaginase [Candidatus Thermoplasmatota archaeon]|nr:isoaspartyl peptidase/L-asparaginase [Candidatus Thermoplasmatota archaeon]